MWELKWGGGGARRTVVNQVKHSEGWGCWMTQEERARAGLLERDGLVFLPLESVLGLCELLP